MNLEEQIATTTALTRVDARRIATALEGAPVYCTSGFWAMVKSGAYSVDEMLERIGSLKAVAR